MEDVYRSQELETWCEVHHTSVSKIAVTAIFPSGEMVQTTVPYPLPRQLTMLDENGGSQGAMILALSELWLCGYDTFAVYDSTARLPHIYSLIIH